MLGSTGARKLAPNIPTRLAAISTALLSALVAGCYAQDFVYAKLVSDNVRVVDIGEPPIGYHRWFGEPIPLKYELIAEDVEMTFSIGKEPWVPDLIIHSSIPIRDVLVKDCGLVHLRSTNEAVMHWSYWDDESISCVTIGELVTIDVELEDFPRVISIVAAVSRSGTALYLDSL